ncbi:MAG: 4Fe-4S ferredoxin [Desulfobacterium sp.]|nr:4Fe-4S ferredoxin [Desulfobacterium sp.]
MASPYWIKTVINRTFSQRFFWSKVSNLPVIGRMIEYALFEDDEIIYLPQKKTIPVNQSIAHEGNLVVPRDVLDHFIEKAGFHFIMDFCICRDSTKCNDYPIDLGCLFLGEAAKGINPKFGKAVSKKEAADHISRCRDAGLVHLIGRNKLDKVWLNVGPGEKLLTICNCCPCCCLWKVLPTISPSIQSKVHRMPGLTVKVTDDCVGCGTCSKDVCFVNAITIENNRAVIRDACRGCGRCVDVCPKNAIEITVDSPDKIENAIRGISELVDVT